MNYRIFNLTHRNWDRKPWECFRHANWSKKNDKTLKWDIDVWGKQADCNYCKKLRYTNSDTYIGKILFLIGIGVYLVALGMYTLQTNGAFETATESDPIDGSNWNFLHFNAWFFGIILACVMAGVVIYLIVQGLAWFLADHSDPKKDKMFSEAQVETEVERRLRELAKEHAIAELDAVDLLSIDLENLSNDHRVLKARLRAKREREYDSYSS